MHIARHIQKRWIGRKVLRQIRQSGLRLRPNTRAGIVHCTCRDTPVDALPSDVA